MDPVIAVTASSIPVHIKREVGTPCYLCDCDIRDLGRLVALLNEHGLRFADNEFVVDVDGGRFYVFAGDKES